MFSLNHMLLAASSGRTIAQMMKPLSVPAVVRVLLQVAIVNRFDPEKVTAA